MKVSACNSATCILATCTISPRIDSQELGLEADTGAHMYTALYAMCEFDMRGISNYPVFRGAVPLRTCYQSGVVAPMLVVNCP